MRQQAVKAVGEGQSASSVAKAYGVSVRTVFRWLASYANGGQKALLAKPIPGRPSKVTDEEMRWLEPVYDLLSISARKARWMNGKLLLS